MPYDNRIVCKVIFSGNLYSVQFDGPKSHGSKHFKMKQGVNMAKEIYPKYYFREKVDPKTSPPPKKNINIVEKH